MFLDPIACRLPGSKPFAVVVLNRPVSLEPSLAIGLWNAGTQEYDIGNTTRILIIFFPTTSASKRVLVDGGAQRWLSYCDRLAANERSGLRRADMLTGDFDSISDGTIAKLEAVGTVIIPTPDQNATDFTKALLELRPHMIENDVSICAGMIRDDSDNICPKIESVVTLVDTGGRIDHIMANINTMCHALELLPPNSNVYGLCSKSMSWLLTPGVEHIIEVPASLVQQQRWCSFVPIGGASRVTTTGLKWNLGECASRRFVRFVVEPRFFCTDNTVVQFGGMVSTSNTYAGERLTIRTEDGLLYWSMGIDGVSDDD